MSKRAIGAAICACLAIGAAIEPATAHKASFDTRVRITGYIDNQSFLGRVGSERKACKRGRRVALWKRNPGAMNAPFGTARTDKRGIWAIARPGAPSGRYYATVKRRVTRQPGHRHVCKAARSKPFVL